MWLFPIPAEQKPELLKAKFPINRRPSNSSSLDKVININCRGRAKFRGKQSEMKAHHAESLWGVVALPSILSGRFGFIRRDKIDLIKKNQ